MAGGLPSPEAFPLVDLRREADRLLSEYGPAVVQYSATDGVPDLRRWLAARFSEEFGREVAVEGQILVTHGSQQALDLLAKIFINPGDIVVSEAPAYLGAIQSLELFEPRFEAIPGDQQGMKVEILAERLARGLRPKLIYVVPNFHNPSGATLSLERRKLLAELADRYELNVIEDDPYGAIRFAGAPLPPIASFSDRVIYLSTFSKIVAPGFRVGWMIGPKPVIAMAIRSKQAADLHTSTFAQQLLSNLVSRPGWIDEQQSRIVPIYRDRCQALADAFDNTFGQERITFHRPEGGMFLWTTIPEVADTTKLLAAGVANGVAFVPGNAFSIDQAPDSFARFSYATLNPDQLRTGANRLHAALEGLSHD